MCAKWIKVLGPEPPSSNLNSAETFCIIKYKGILTARGHLTLLHSVKGMDSANVDIVLDMDAGYPGFKLVENNSGFTEQE